MISLTLTQDKEEMTRLLKYELGGLQKNFKATDFEMDIKPLLKLVMSNIFGNSS
jgi:hypothetical protein